jgi:hypothetical protein
MVSGRMAWQGRYAAGAVCNDEQLQHVMHSLSETVLILTQH